MFTKKRGCILIRNMMINDQVGQYIFLTHSEYFKNKFFDSFILFETKDCNLKLNQNLKLSSKLNFVSHFFFK